MAKVQESVEYYTVLRSQRAAERADVALVVCDAHGRRHLPGPAHRRAGHEVGLRDGARAQQVGPDERRRVRPRARARAGGAEAAAAPARADRLGADRPPRAAAAAGGALARRPRRAPHPHAGAQPLPRRGRAAAPAAAEAGPPAQAALHGADRRPAAALLHPRQPPPAHHARLRVLRREPPARALRARGHPAGDRLRRAQEPPAGVPDASGAWRKVFDGIDEHQRDVDRGAARVLRRHARRWPRTGTSTSRPRARSGRCGCSTSTRSPTSTASAAGRRRSPTCARTAASS